jgi:hypothetical protein
VLPTKHSLKIFWLFVAERVYDEMNPLGVIIAEMGSFSKGS